MICIIGDVHGDFDSLNRIIQDNPTISHFFQVGDLGMKNKPYPNLPTNFHFIKGNHENWNDLKRLHSKPGLYLKNGEMYTYEDIIGHKRVPFTVMVLGGNLSPKFYLKRFQDLQGARERHFIEDEVKSLINISTPCDIFLTHEAPSPFVLRGSDIGQHIISEIIRINSPGIHFFGHHHTMHMSEIYGVRSLGLGRASQSYVLYDISIRKIIPVIHK